MVIVILILLWTLLLTNLFYSGRQVQKPWQGPLEKFSGNNSALTTARLCKLQCAA